MQVLALDIGTSSVRARVYDETGTAIEDAQAQTRYELTHGHDGRAEFDADHLVEATQAALGEVRREADEAPAALCGACFWHSLVPVDARGRAIGPLLTWRDTRSAAASERLARRLDAEEVHARTGCMLHASYWPSKLTWLAESEPELFRRAARFLSFSDYLYLRLTGELRTSLSMASGTGLVDVGAGRWDARLLDELSLDAQRLPTISDEPVDHDEPWFPLIGDGAASNVGAGCVTRDRAALMIGTSGAYRTVFSAAATRPRPGLFLYRLDDPRVVEGGSLSDGGNLYAWLAQTLRLDGLSAVEAAPPAGHGLTFLTLLGGERSPGWKAAARGAVTGLSFDTTPVDVLQAAFEGVAYRFAEIAELMPEVGEVVATGHALLADHGWIQILADVLERRIQVSAVEEASARGAAVVALERLGASPAPAPLGPVFEPRAERFEAHRAARERQRALYDHVT